MAETIIGKSLLIDGEITGQTALTVLGTVKGRIDVDDQLTIGQSAVVEADVSGSDVQISGQVTGNVQAAGRVEITKQGRMIGDLKAPRIHIADGASFKGNVDMDV